MILILTFILRIIQIIQCRLKDCVYMTHYFIIYLLFILFKRFSTLIHINLFGKRHFPHIVIDTPNYRF